MLSKAEEQELSDLLTDTFNSIMRVEGRSLDNRLTRSLSIAEIHAIEAIGLHQQNPMSEIAARLHVTLATLTVSVKRLEEKGFVTRSRNAHDRRQMLVSLTTRGREAYRAHELFHRHMVEGCFSDLTHEEERALVSGLSKVKAYFESREAQVDD